MSAPKPGFRWRILLLAAVTVVAGWALFRAVRPRPVAEPELALADLVRMEGRLVFRNDTNRVFTGWVTEHYASGTPRSRSHVVDGRLEGLSEGWHTNGVLQVREPFVNGLSEGVVTKWHADGTKQSEGTAKAGKFEGNFRRWHTNGVLAEELILVSGQPHGLARSWFPSGSLKAEVMLEQGQVVKQQFWKDGEQPALAAAEPNGTQP